MELSAPLNLTTAKVVAFQVTFTNGVCTDGSPPPALKGVLAALCEVADGSGYLDPGHHRFAISWRPGALALTGDVTGAVNVAPDPADPQTCAIGVGRLLVTGGSFALAA